MLKEHCIIHIGMHKTGTTSIQKTLSQYLKNNHQIHYLDLGKPNHSLPIYSLFGEKKKPHSIHQKQGLSAKEINNYNQQVKKMLENEFLYVDSQTMLISGEGISILPTESLIRLKKYLQKFFRKITIVAYIRPPKSYMQSAFQQRMKVKGESSFLLPYPEYYRRFERFDHIFGKENVLFWKYNPNIFQDGDVVSDFCMKLNFPIPEETFVQVNKSLSKEAIQLLYIYRKYRPGFGVGPTSIKENQNLIQHLRKIGTNKFTFSPGLIQPILNKKVKDIAWIENRLGEPLSENMSGSINDIASEEDLFKLDETVVTQLEKTSGKKLFSSNHFYENIADILHYLKFQKKILSGNKQS